MREFQIFVAGVFLFLATQIKAQDSVNLLFDIDFDLAYIDKKTPVQVRVHDGVTGGCWLTASAAENKVKRELIEAGFSNVTNDDQIFGITIEIQVLGFETNAYSCAATPIMRVFTNSYSQREVESGEHEWLSFYIKEIYSDVSILIGPKSGISSRINSQIESFVDAFIVTIHQEKRELFDQVSKTKTEDVFKAPLLNAAAPLKR